MSSWTLAPALATLRAELNSEWPKRATAMDGTIGDAAHAARKSEHNPNRDPRDDVPDGMVTAMDIDVHGINVERVVNTLKRDARVWYVIHDRHIYSRTYGFVRRPYEGPDPHINHIHVSLVQHKSLLNDIGAWGIFRAVVAPARVETPLQRAQRSANHRAQMIAALRAKVANLLARLGSRH